MELMLRESESQGDVNKKINNALNAKYDNLYNEYKHYDLSNLIAPYYVNPYQRQMLKDIIGTKNVEDIEMLNSLVYAGIINVNCPPIGNPELSEKYVDPVSGKVQCRRKTNVDWDKLKNTVPNPQKTCPPPDNPLAIEKYINSLNEVDCRMPVIRGQFNCPPSTIIDNNRNIQNNSTYMEHMTLSDGTGTCTEPYNINSPGLYPNDIVKLPAEQQLFYGKNMYEKIQNYMGIFDDIGLNVNLIEPLNKLIKESPYLGDFRANFLKKPSLEPLYSIIPHVNTDDDLRILNTSLYEYLKNKFPEHVKRKNITYGGFMGMTGGYTKKRSSKKRSSKKRSSKKRSSKKRSSKRLSNKKRSNKKRSSKK
jgi:hypothetical protein